VGAGAPGTAGRKRWSIKHTFKAATFHQITAGEIWARDVVTEKALVLNSTVRVPDLPGLGVTIDRDAIAELEVYQPPTQADWIMRSRFGNGSTMYTRVELSERTGYSAIKWLHRPEQVVGLPPMEYRGVSLERVIEKPKLVGKHSEIGVFNDPF
jgi:hypothetical protein